MPVYCFRTVDDGELVEEQMSYATLEDVCVDDRLGLYRLADGRLARVDFSAQGVKTTPPGNWPKESLALGVATEQIPEAKEHYRKLGINAEFNPRTGAMKIPSRSHQNEVLEKTGQRNCDAGYSDWNGRTKREIDNATAG